MNAACALWSVMRDEVASRLKSGASKLDAQQFRQDACEAIQPMTRMLGT